MAVYIVSLKDVPLMYIKLHQMHILKGEYSLFRGCTFKVHKRHQRYNLKGYSIVSLENAYVWKSLCTVYLLACQVRVTVGDSGLCCYVRV